MLFPVFQAERHSPETVLQRRENVDMLCETMLTRTSNVLRDSVASLSEDISQQPWKAAFPGGCSNG